MKFYYLLPAALIGISTALVLGQFALALSSTEVGKIAVQITVRIESKNSPGSGVIIQHEGNTYTVLTCKHVVAKADKYTIVTADGGQYPLDYSSVKKLPSGLDLALVKFTSNKNYTVAKIGNSDTATVGTDTYVAGFPAPTAVVSRSLWRFSKGEITANATQPLDEGYALVYSNSTIEGMSGGAVLNENGELIGIHGRAETTVDDDSKRIRTGFNLGIPINAFVKQFPVSTAKLSPTKLQPTTALIADEFFIQGRLKLVEDLDYQGAIADFTQSLRLHPNNADAYYNRGLARYHLGEIQEALVDLQQAAKLCQQQGKTDLCQKAQNLIGQLQL